MKQMLLVAMTCALNAFASCGEGKVAKYRVVIAWNALNDLPSFDAAIKKTHASLGARSDHTYFLRGGRFNNLAWPGKNAPPGTTVETPNREGLLKTARDISSRFTKLRESGVSADDFEVDFVVTNHGDALLNGPQRDYGLVASNIEPDGWVKSAPLVASADLKDFAEALPPGIRFKAIFGQCYGGSSMPALLKNIRSPARCACGIAQTEPGYPGYGSRIGTANWESLMVDRLGKGQGLLEATWAGIALRATGGKGALDEDEKSGPPGYNVGLSSSSHHLQDVLRRQFPDYAKAETLEMEQKSREILSLAEKKSGKPLADKDRKWLETMHQRRQTYLSVEKKTTGTKAEDSIDTLLKKQAGDDSFLRGTAEERIARRENLEKAFYQIATEKEKQEYQQLVACEYDPLMSAFDSDSRRPSPDSAHGDQVFPLKPSNSDKTRP